MAELNRQIEEHELKALKASDGEEYRRIREDLEIRALQGEVDAHEETETATEVEVIAARLEQKLKCVLHRESSGLNATDASGNHESQ